MLAKATIVLLFLVVAAAVSSASMQRANVDRSPSHPRSVWVVGSNIHSDLPNAAVIQIHFDGATEMRFGNTRVEAAMSAWEPVVETRVWYLPGFNYRIQQVVFAQFRGPKLKPVEIQAPVYAAEPGERVIEGDTFPFVEVPDSRSSDVIIAEHFDSWNERWATYQDAYGYGNVFFPMTHQSRGGVNNGGFVWTGPSRRAVDAPEQPDSILVAMNYWRWLFSDEWRARTGASDVVDLRNATLSVALRGRGLTLGRTRITFWVLTNGARWHLRTPLSIGENRWVTNRVFLPVHPSAWELSWSREGRDSTFDLSTVESYGFALRGFRRDAKINGSFDMDEFTLARTCCHRSE
jgi:hypothetical protein